MATSGAAAGEELDNQASSSLAGESGVDMEHPPESETRRPSSKHLPNWHFWPWLSFGLHEAKHLLTTLVLKERTPERT